MTLHRLFAPSLAFALAATAAGCGQRAAEEPIIPSTPLRAVDTPPPDYPLEIGCDQVGGKVVLQLTVGAENVVTRGKNPFAPGNGEKDEGTVPYVRYEQDL